jgi:hypothetical protein
MELMGKSIIKTTAWEPRAQIHYGLGPGRSHIHFVFQMNLHTSSRLELNISPIIPVLPTRRVPARDPPAAVRPSKYFMKAFLRAREKH